MNKEIGIEANVNGITPLGEGDIAGSVLPFSQDGMVDKVARTPLPLLLYNLIELPHAEIDAGTSYAKLANLLIENLDLSEADEERIFCGEGPNNDDEKEIMLITDLRGAFSMMVIQLLQDPSLSQKVKDELFQSALDNPTDDWQHTVNRTYIIKHYYEGLDEDKRANMFIQMNQGVEDGIRNLYDKAEALIGFWREKRNLPGNVAEINRPGSELMAMSREDRARIDIADYFIKVFSPDTEPKFMTSLYAGTLESPEELLRQRGAYRNSPQFRKDLISQIEGLEGVIKDLETGEADQSLYYADKSHYEESLKIIREQLRQLDAGEPVQEVWEIEILS